MIKHVVMFKLSKKTPQNMEHAVQALKSLEGNIEALKAIEIGSDFLESERSYDIVLIAQFDNQEDLNFYTQHENHLPVVKIMRSLCSSSVVVDYKI